MNHLNGYIYVRNHPSYDINNACKMGKTNNIPERDTAYATGEINRGYFEVVFEVPNKQLGIIERLLQNEFQEFNIKYDAGTEFYNKKIIDVIEPYLMTLNVIYKKLSKQEISELVRCNRIKNLFEKINKKSLIQTLKSKETFTPREDQIAIINKSITYFQENDKGLLILICGIGKTLISLWITQSLNFTTILIGVPNKLLLKQWEKVINILFQNMPYLIVSGDIMIETIINFLRINNNKCVIITTYASSFKVNKAIQRLTFVFDMKINDEVHHLTSMNMKLEETTKNYIEMLKIPSIKQLSLTATIKQLENSSSSSDEMVISNDNIEYFGEIIDRKNLLWAIKKEIVCDYVIQTIITNKEQLEKETTNFNITEENDKRLFLSSYASLKSICENNTHHILIYTNNKENSSKIITYIKMLLDKNNFDIPDLYYSNYHSEMNSKTQKDIIDKFENATIGIITCVYCLGEGFDFPLLDCVVFAENMTSNIRIVQSALRASRKNKEEKDKITKIILPISDKNDWFESSNPDFKKVREVIYYLGLEDETICQKIKVIQINFTGNIKYNSREKKKGQLCDFGEYNDNLTELLRLKTIHRSSINITYEKARKIIAGKNIKSKEDYYDLCDNDNRLSKEPEIIFKGQFTNWIEYLSIERIYYDLTTCKNKIDEYLLLYPEIKTNHLNLSLVCQELCKLDDKFPPHALWVEYYKIKNLQEIITIINKKKKLVISL